MGKILSALLHLASDTDRAKYMNYPRIMIAATKSGCGKTTITCALLKALIDRGMHPCSFKCGPDYIDPMYHRQVIEIPSGNLDTFFTDDSTTADLLLREYSGDIAIVEGVMGLYDGVGGVEERGSSYDLAHTLNCPIILVVDARGAGRSVLAEIRGFLSYDKYHLIKGVILNKISQHFAGVLKPLIEEELGVKVLGTMPNDKSITITSRHLGLMLPEEMVDLKNQLTVMAEAAANNISLEDIIAIAEDNALMKETVCDICKKDNAYTVRLAVARDSAFCFYYRENLKLLEERSVDIIEFSPIHDDNLPKDISGVLLGGGYPENYLDELESNISMKNSVKAAIDGGIPVMAECGGFMYLLDEIIDEHSVGHTMVGAISGRATWVGKLVRFGYVTIECDDVHVRGHEFHYYDTNNNGTACRATKPTGSKSLQCMHKLNGGYVGFPHLYYPSAPEFVDKFVEAMRNYGRRYKI